MAYRSTKFWIHNVILKTSSELLNPTRKQGIHETQNPSKKSIPQNNKKSTRETKYSMEVEDNLLGDRLDISEWNQFLKLIGDYQRETGSKYLRKVI